jgi:hypothetical protein
MIPENGFAILPSRPSLTVDFSSRTAEQQSAQTTSKWIIDPMEITGCFSTTASMLEATAKKSPVAFAPVKAYDATRRFCVAEEARDAVDSSMKQSPRMQVLGRMAGSAGRPAARGAAVARVCVVLLGVWVLSNSIASAGAATKKTVVTVISDSVAASISYVPAAQADLEHGLAVRLDLKVCRRLIEPSCPYEGSAPPTALSAVKSYGSRLGQVLVVDVGYNDSSSGYARGIDTIMRAALKQGVRSVVWVTLREDGGYASDYRSINAEIKTATRRWPQLIVADWNAYSAGKSWFGTDGLHLTASGATALASFLRPFVIRASSQDRSR